MKDKAILMKTAGKHPQPPIQVAQLEFPRDLPEVVRIWNAALPHYPLPAENLQKLLPNPNAHHLGSWIESTLVGFCLTYTTTQPSTTSGYLAVLAVDPERQGQGVGTALCMETFAWFRGEFRPCRLELGSGFPRFWPGVPTDLPSTVLDFFVHRGFQIRPSTPRSADLYQSINQFSAGQKYIDRAAENGYTFGPLQPQHYEECLAGQERNFAYNTDWVKMYYQLNPRERPSSIMVAFDSNGKQAGWTLMLSPSSDILQHNWAFPPLCGPDTGLVGCVGVDKDYRGSGIGLALVAHAVHDMRKRGIQGVFVDWVSMEGYYEKLGFEDWRSYRTGEIIFE